MDLLSLSNPSYGINSHVYFSYDARPGYQWGTLLGQDCTEHQVCSQYNHGECKWQVDPYCAGIPEGNGAEKRLLHACNFVLPCSGFLCGSKDHSALDHELLPAHCWVCYNTVFAFTGWIKRERNLGLGDTILVEYRLKTGQGFLSCDSSSG